MRPLLVGAAAAIMLASAPAAFAQVDDLPAPRLSYALDQVGDRPLITDVQFFFSGRNYCWYDGGWQGPGYYWCGYAWRRGYGWGGGYGWHGWRGGHPGGGYGRGGGGREGGGHAAGGHYGGGHSGGQVATGGGHAGAAHAGGGGGHAGGGGGGHGGGGHEGGGHGHDSK